MEKEVVNKNGKSAKNADENGPLIGSLIIILIVIVGGLYFFNNTRDKIRPVKDEAEPEAATENIDTEGDVDLEYINELEDIEINFID